MSVTRTSHTSVVTTSSSTTNIMTNIGEAHTVLRPSRGRGPDPRTLFYLMTTTTHALLPSSLTMPARINGRAERADAANAPPQRPSREQRGASRRGEGRRPHRCASRSRYEELKADLAHAKSQRQSEQKAKLEAVARAEKAEKELEGSEPKRNKVTKINTERTFNRRSALLADDVVFQGNPELYLPL